MLMFNTQTRTFAPRKYVQKFLKHDLLRQIPKVDELLKHADMAPLLAQHPRSQVLAAIRATLEHLRQAILNDQAGDVSLPAIVRDVERGVQALQARHVRRVINGTGIIVHTNLGRSNLSRDAMAAVVETASAYSNLEYDLARGARGSRYSHVEGLLCELLGCESALVVNNNAAAVLLVLSALGQGQEAIVSRGELVEIGGSFRIPEVMQQGGCCLREVGATNRTHLRDYEQAIGDDTALILKVHTSNYRILGFTATVPLPDLRRLCDQHHLPLVEDMGSGLLLDLSPFGLPDEPTVQASVQAGVDVVTFSGDKLLGGPQAGLIVGKRRYIDLLKKHPLTRAVRIDKMTLAALEATLRHYRDRDEALRQIPTLRLLALSLPELRAKADRLCALLRTAGIPAALVESASHVGGGALPTEDLPTWCVALDIPEMSANALETRLRQGTPAIIGRIARDRFLLDVRTLEETDFEMIVNSVEKFRHRADA
jgi:L-seryl-tRNA(Ser) seleniumtransferase